jgi:hypothetical protein
MSIEDFLSNNCIQNVRTGDLSRQNRKYILLRLLLKLLESADFQAEVSVCCASAEKSASSAVVDLVHDDSKDEDDGCIDEKQVSPDEGAAVLDADSVDETLPKSRKGKSENKNKAEKKMSKVLKDLSSHGDFSFENNTSKKYNTRNGGELTEITGGQSSSADKKGKGKGNPKKPPAKGIKNPPAAEKIKPPTVVEEKLKRHYGSKSSASAKKRKTIDEPEDDDYGAHYDSTTLFDQANFQRTINDAARTAAEVATAELNRKHEAEMKRVKDELGLLKRNSQQRPPPSSIHYLLSYLI